MIRGVLKIAGRKGIRTAVRLLAVFPIKKNRILFESFQGRLYACNPKYLSEYLQKIEGGKYELIWTFREPEKYRDIPGIRTVRYKSLPWLYYQMTAKVLVTNSNLITVIPKRKGQLVLETWHAGGAYKRVGDDVESYNSDKKLITRWNQRLENEKIDIFVSSSAEFSKWNIRKAHCYRGRILKSGMPRNDLFFDAEAKKAAEEKVRRRYDIRGKLILYAPTWRGIDIDHSEQLNTIIDYDRLLAAVSEEEEPAAIMVRSHYSDSNRYSGEGRVIDVTDYPDMQELLCAADYLITDYSSSIWDFALTGKPAFLYVPDLSNYENDERGFFTPIEDWPAEICTDMDALCEAVRNPDREAHKKRAERHLAAFGSYEDGHACEALSKLIKKAVSG